MEAVVCGIDPGMGITGYALLSQQGQDCSLIEGGVCRFASKQALAPKLAAIEADITSILQEHQPDVVAVESLYAHYNHPRTAILMGHARGVILLAAARMGIEVQSYAATQIKRYLTGNGRATKVQMQRAIQHTLGLSAPPEPADVADAVAVALCCAADRCKTVTPGVVR